MDVVSCTSSDSLHRASRVRRPRTRLYKLTAVYEVRLTTTYITGLDDGCYACALVEESRTRRPTDWKIFQQSTAYW